MTTNDEGPIDPDQLELDDVMLDLAADGADPAMMDALLKHGKTVGDIEKYAEKIDKIIKKRK